MTLDGRDEIVFSARKKFMDVAAAIVNFVNLNENYFEQGKINTIKALLERRQICGQLNLVEGKVTNKSSREEGYFCLCATEIQCSKCKTDILRRSFKSESSILLRYFLFILWNNTDFEVFELNDDLRDPNCECISLLENTLGESITDGNGSISCRWPIFDSFIINDRTNSFFKRNEQYEERNSSLRYLSAVPYSQRPDGSTKTISSTVETVDLDDSLDEIRKTLSYLESLYLEVVGSDYKNFDAYIEPLVLSDRMMSILGYLLTNSDNKDMSDTDYWEEILQTVDHKVDDSKLGDTKVILEEGEEGEEEEEINQSEKIKKLIFNIMSSISEEVPLKICAIDCEMCRTSSGSELTRLSIVSPISGIVFDEFVKPQNKVIDYLTEFSGVTEENLQNAYLRLEDIHFILRHLMDCNTVIVGHSLDSDLKALKLIHRRNIDTVALFPHRKGQPFKLGLKAVCKEVLNISIREDSSKGHDSILDAVMALYLALLLAKEGKCFNYINIYIIILYNIKLSR